jgi:hypothetical protein
VNRIAPDHGQIPAHVDLARGRRRLRLTHDRSFPRPLATSLAAGAVAAHPQDG